MQTHAPQKEISIIVAGASLAQIDIGVIYRGPELVREIAQGLCASGSS